MAVPMTEYNPLKVCPILHKSSQDFGIPVTATSPLHSNLPSVYWPEDPSNMVRPKFKRVIGSKFLTAITPAR